MKNILILMVLTGAMISGVCAQNHIRALANADTIAFSVNKQEGWLLYNSYVEKMNQDSAMVGLILQQSRHFDWGKEHLVGYIKSPTLAPLVDQVITIHAMPYSYRLHIDRQGLCYLQLISGAMPDIDSVVLPIKVKYSLR